MKYRIREINVVADIVNSLHSAGVAVVFEDNNGKCVGQQNMNIYKYGSHGTVAEKVWKDLGVSINPEVEELFHIFPEIERVVKSVTILDDASTYKEICYQGDERYISVLKEMMTHIGKDYNKVRDKVMVTVGSGQPDPTADYNVLISTQDDLAFDTFFSGNSNTIAGAIARLSERYRTNKHLSPESCEILIQDMLKGDPTARDFSLMSRLK